MAGTLARRNSVLIHGTARTTARALLCGRQRNTLGTGPHRNGISATWRWLVHNSLAQRADAPRGIWATQTTKLVSTVFSASRCCWFTAAVGLVLRGNNRPAVAVFTCRARRQPFDIAVGVAFLLAPT